MSRYKIQAAVAVTLIYVMLSFAAGAVLNDLLNAPIWVGFVAVPVAFMAIRELIR